MRNPTIAGFISPRATCLVVSHDSSASSSPRTKRSDARDCLGNQQTTSEMQRTAFHQKSRGRRSDWKSHREPSRSGALRLPFAQVRLARLPHDMEGASTWVNSIDILSTRGRERPAAAATARRQLHGCATPAHRQSPGCAATTRRPSPGACNESLSKITRHRQIVGTGASQPRRDDLRWRTSSVGARDWAAKRARDRMVRVSQNPLLPMQHITPVLRVAAFGRWPPRAG
jgi:hypothetical protein